MTYCRPVSGGYAAMQAMMTSGLTANESRVYAYLVFRSNGARECWRTVEDIQADLHIKARHTVCDATATLRKAGLIGVTRRYRGANHYTMLDPDGCLYGGEAVHQSSPIVQKTTPLPPSPIVQKTTPLGDGRRAKNHTTRDAGDVQKTAHQEKTPKEEKEDSQEREEKKVVASLLPTRARARPTGKHELPEDWNPREQSFALAASLGLDAGRVGIEAEKMRGWAVFKAVRGRNWDMRFDNWLREAADRRPWREKTVSTFDQIRMELGGDSFLFPDPEPPEPMGSLIDGRATA